MVYFEGLDGKSYGSFDRGVDGTNTALDGTDGIS